MLDTLQLLEEKDYKNTGMPMEDLKFWRDYWLWKFSRKEDWRSVNFCKFLLEEGANPNASIYVNSPFHRTARFGNKNLLRYLLENRKFFTHVDAVNKLGWTSLHNAALFDEEECAYLLLIYGADSHIASRDGMAIDIARRYNCTNVVKLLKDLEDEVRGRTVRQR